MTIESASHPKVTLVEGDPFVALNKILEIKHARFPSEPLSSEWVEFDVPRGAALKKFINEKLNSVDSEVCSQNWDGNHKVVYLRGVIDNKDFRSALAKMVSSVAEGNSLIIWDEDGVIRKDKGRGKASPGASSWRGFKELCKKHGEVLSFGVPLEEMSREYHTEFVTSRLKKHGRHISPENVLLVLEMLPPNRAILETELDRLAENTAKYEVSDDEIRNIIFPLYPEHQSKVYGPLGFAFNTGNYNKIMDVSDMFHHNDEIPYETLIGVMIDMAGWHLAAAHILTYNKDLLASLTRFSQPKDPEAVTEMIRARHDLPDRFFGPPPKRRKYKSIMYPNQVKEAVTFVTDILAMHVGKKDNLLKELVLLATKRYLVLYEAAVEIRLASEDDEFTLFQNAVRKVSWRA